MISTLKTKINTPLFVTLALFFVLLVSAKNITVAKAQSSLTLSVSPTLFDMAASPGQDWPSQIRIINSNPYDITVYAEVVNFAPDGESGSGKFLPRIGQNQEGTIAEWINFSNTKIDIPAEQTLDVPFTISVPEDAPPGGHFAAILIGTRPPNGSQGPTQVQTSQVVSSLVFLRVAGEIREDGLIRSFRTTSALLEKPEATFELRFENKGNVHILPQGEIKIYNMWGEERGTVPINRETLFGNVLPESIRKYVFTWEGEPSLSDMGRYRAVAALAYGDQKRQFADEETYFWVIPWKILLFILLGLIVFFVFIAWSIKLYIRKMLAMSGMVHQSEPQIVKGAGRKQPKRRVSFMAPIGEGMLDLRGQLQNTHSLPERITVFKKFVAHYRLFFIAVASTILFILIVFVYVSSASVSERAYNVTIGTDSGSVELSSEEIVYQSLPKSPDNATDTVTEDLPSLRLINRSGVLGLAARSRTLLERSGYAIDDIENDFDVAEDRTIIVYPPELAEEALALSELLGNALLSSYIPNEGDDIPFELTVYIGKDMRSVVQ